MKIEIIKRQALTSPQFYYYIYIDGNQVDVYTKEADARRRVAELEESHLNPAEPEIIYSKEL